MILLVSPHNVVKKDYYVNNFSINETNELNTKNYSIYSQGMNVSNCLKILQTVPFILTFLGGVNGKHVKNQLHVHKIKFDSIHVSMNSYEKVNIIDEINHTHTVINDSYSMVNDKIAAAYLNLYKENIQRSEFVIFEDRLNEYINESYVFQMAKEADNCNVRKVLDVKSNLSDEYISTIKPYLIKFNQKSLSAYNQRWDDINPLIDFAKKYLDFEIHYVLIDLAEDGILVFDKNNYFMVDSKSLNKKYDSKNQATDAMLAGFLTGLSKKYEIEKTLKLAYASELAVFEYGSIDVLNRKNIFDLRNETAVRHHHYDAIKEVEE